MQQTCIQFKTKAFYNFIFFFLRWAFLEFHNYRGNYPKYSSDFTAFQDNLHKYGIWRGLLSRMPPNKINITSYDREITEFHKRN